MSKHRTYNWPLLFAEFERLGLSQTEFCKQHDINPKYFSLKLSKRKVQEAGAFMRAVVSTENLLPQGLILEVGKCKIYCPQSMSTVGFASLVEALA